MNQLRALCQAKKQKSMLGAKSTAFSGTCRARLDGMSGKGLEHLKIEGGTLDGVSLGDNGIRVRLASKNLINVDKLVELILSYDSNARLVEADGRRCIKYKNSATYTKDLSDCCPKFKEGTRYILSFEARPETVQPSTATYDGSLFISFDPSGASVSSSLEAKKTTEFSRIYVISKAEKTVTDINLSWGSSWNWLIDLDSVYLYEYEGDNNPEYEKPLVEEIVIPSEVTLNDGSILALALADGEELTYDKGTLTYKKGEDVYDLSDTEVAKALASLKGVYNTDFELEIKGNSTPTSITVCYYSTKNQDQRVLTACYLCGGEEIMPPKEYTVRKDSIYRIIPPYIKGYKAPSNEPFGVINEDTTIILNYSKE